MSLENCCKLEIDALRDELNRLKFKEAELKEQYKNSLIENVRKDLILRDLEVKARTKLFVNFEIELPALVLDNLRSKSINRSDDASFVSIVLNGLYDNNTEILKTRTISGRSDGGDKEAISPAKKAILEKIFNERLESMPAYEVDEARKKSLSKLIRVALDIVQRAD